MAAIGFFEGGQALARELRGPKDPSSPTPFERLHLPTLTVPSFTRNGAHVPIEVEMTHPMEAGHYVEKLHVLNESDPIPSKGILHLTPANGRAYLATQARMHSGASHVLVVAHCNRHGPWAVRRPITIPQGADGCASVTEGQEAPPVAEEIEPPVIRIPELVSRGRIRRGEVVRVQLKFKHPNRTGLALRDGKFVQAAEPFYITAMEAFYGDRAVSRYEMTPALSDNPLITFKLRATEERRLRIVLTNSRGQRFEATEEIECS